MSRKPLIGSLLILVACCFTPLRAAAPVEAPTQVLSIDLAPLIKQSAQHRERFAVDVPQRISTATQGEWTASGSMRYWTYRVRIPGAVSMSFHAGQVVLPASAQLTVEGASGRSTYSAHDVRRAAIWSRPLLGDRLSLTLAVSAAEQSSVAFEILSLQAGYRGLSSGAPDHPYYKSLQAAAGEALPACVQNYACNTTDANRGPGQATVAVLIGNVLQCTGTLLNNTREDSTPYVLTARHCENGELGGSVPNIAGSVTIYWNATSACGQVLGEIYNGATATQTGATTVVEQQDAWLIKLDEAPRIPDAYFAGWDATGGVFIGGYAIHHALGLNKQFVSWYGQAVLQRMPGSTLQAPYDSDFWGVVNQLGNVGEGASGGALFDPNNRVVGSASLAYINTATGEGICPFVTPPAPAPDTVTALYTAVSAIWDSTSDPSSTTGDATLRKALDPDGTGRLTVDGSGYMPVRLQASTFDEQTGQLVTLSWNEPWAQSCTASGGVPGDGWQGIRGAVGSAQVTELTGGIVDYVLSCKSSDRRGTATTRVGWTFVAPLIELLGPTTPVLPGVSFSLRWGGNVRSCTASGGLPGDGWAGSKGDSGEQLMTIAQLGATTYSISCGTGARTAAAQVTVNVVAPEVSLHSDATRLRIGSYFNIWWTSNAYGSLCSGSGGVPAWVQNTQDVQAGGSTMSTSDVPGIFTYTMTCTAAGLTTSSSFTIEFVDEPPTLSLAAVAPQQEIYPPGTFLNSGTPNLLWTSNQGFCFLISLAPNGLGNRSVDLKGQYPAGNASAVELIAGTYEYDLLCNGLTARTTIEWVTSHPTVTIWEVNGVSTWVAGYQYQLWWSTNTVPCTASGGAAGDAWTGVPTGGAGGAVDVRAPTIPGTYTYTMTCGTGSSTSHQDFLVTVPPAAVTLTASPASPSVEQPVFLKWNSTAYPCSANADGAGVNWGASNMIYAGQGINFQTLPGTYTYTITCGSGANAVTASTQVTFRATPPTFLTASASSAPVNTPVTLLWESGSDSCDAIGGVANDGWSGPKPPSGTMTVTSPTVGMVGYAINCGSGGQSLVVTYTAVPGDLPDAPTPSVSLTASQAQQVAGRAVTLTWSSRNANACVASGGANGDGWRGSLSLSGTMTVTRADPGSSIYTITCTGAPPASTAQTTVTFSAAPGTGGGGGGGGGGSLERYVIAFLLLLTAGRMQRWVKLPIRARMH